MTHPWPPTCKPGNPTTYQHGGLSAYFESLRGAEAYYGTLSHEATHWTSAKARLDRDFGGHRFGTDAYAMEELVAELGSAFL